MAIERIDAPRVGPGELLVDIDLATVCGADRAAVAAGGGDARVLGHEGVGRVLDAGRGAPAAVGDRIVWGPTVSCGRCDRCRAGLSAACRKARALGEQPVDGPWPLSGTFARRMLLPRGAAVAQAPPELCDPVAASAGCAAACVLSAYERVGALPGTRVLILGAGLLGLTAAAYANDAGAAAIAVADRDAARRTLARMFGATESVDPVDGLPDADVVIDFTRSGDLITAGLGALTVGGRLIMVEQHRATPVADTGTIAIDGHRATARWHSVSGVSGAEPHHIAAAVEYLTAARARWPWEQLITSAVPMSYLPTLLETPAPIAPRTAVQPRR
ncbi:alcohol dehydrogenase catalytic domain-containing protein [Microbacterium halophytorum]|uniref:alcohol dehydrogenase catalytic domain-containing protein n=1 Tax=Microbacterium halophytorum TaxID=2067568 RepID=UPI00131A43C5|nr:alcohol dehydrogenase catalytic domain-containing protein [Microbacterium halophytorum]